MIRRRPVPDEMDDDAQMLARSGLFDRSWYSSQVGTRLGMDPERHYLTEGARAGLDPSPFFQTRWYLDSNPDVAALGINPLLHYLTWGRHEGRLPAPLTLWLEMRGGHARARLAALRWRPLISVAMATYETREAYLRAAVGSVLHQLYPHWELCIADDASASPDVARVLGSLPGDARIKIKRRTTRGGIVAANNDALALASGEFVALMDHDDLLAKDALLAVAEELQRAPDADVLFSDEVLVDAESRPTGIYCKPGWNPELMLGQNMISHLGVYRSTLLQSLGGFRSGYDGSQDHDLALRAVAASRHDRIRHIPQPLYFWRRIPEAFSARRAAFCAEATRRAVTNFLEATGQTARVEDAPDTKGHQRVRPILRDPPPMVSVILAGRPDTAPPDIVRRYPSQETISTSDTPAARNQAAAKALGEVLVFLDADLGGDDDEWLAELAAQAMRRDIGAVGGKIVGADQRIVSAGLALDRKRIAVPLHRGVPVVSAGYYGQLALARDVAAVPVACFAIRRELFASLGGFDTGPAGAAFGDVDLCLRLRQRGLRVIFTPHARLSSPAEFDLQQTDGPPRLAARTMHQRWGEALSQDPFGNPNLVVEGWGLAVPPRSRP